MNNNKVSYKIINDAGEWFKLLENDQYKIHELKFFNQDTIQVFIRIIKINLKVESKQMLLSQPLLQHKVDYIYIMRLKS